jgi:hypothetical protein
MKRSAGKTLLIVLGLLITASAAQAAESKLAYPVALFRFEERGTTPRDLGQKVMDLLFANLVANPDIFLVDRADLDKALAELALNASGAVKPDEAAKVGNLTGAKLLVTGSVVQVDLSLYLVAKIIGTETSRVAGASVQGKVTDDLGGLVEKLAAAVSETILKRGEGLVPKPVSQQDRLAALKAKLKDSKKPIVWIRVAETHFGQPVIDPAVQTELSKYCLDTGFEVLDPEETAKSKADVVITGEGFSEVASRVGNLFAVKARIEIKAIDWKTNKVLFVDRETSVALDLAERVAGKAALQDAADKLADRLLPKLVHN